MTFTNIGDRMNCLCFLLLVLGTAFGQINGGESKKFLINPLKESFRWKCDIIFSKVLHDRQVLFNFTIYFTVMNGPLAVNSVPGCVIMSK